MAFRLPSVSREQALKMFTIWPAFAAFEEKDKGTIAAGKFADLTVLDNDLVRTPVEEISKLKVAMTIISGEIVFKV